MKKSAEAISIILRIIKYVNTNRLLAILTVVSSLFLALTAQFLPQIQRIGIDRYIQPPKNSDFIKLNTQERISGLIYIVIIYLIFIVLKFILGHIFIFCSVKLSQNILYRIRNDLFAKLQYLPLSFFDKNSVGNLMSRINYDVEGIKNFFISGFSNFIQSLFFLVTIVINMAILNWQLTLIVLGMVAVFTMYAYLMQRKMEKLYADAHDKRTLISSYFNEAVTGVLTIQLFNRKKKVIHAFNKRNNDLLGANQNISYWYPLVQVVLPTLYNLILVVILWYGSGQAIQSLITLGTLIAFRQYMENLFDIRDIWFNFMDSLQSARASAKTIFSILDTDNQIVNDKKSLKIDNFRGEIEFKGVFFSYETGENTSDDSWILKDLSFKINPGESVALVGATGAGKSSIISLIPRFYQVKRGQILVDGVNIDNYQENDLRKHISIVLQDVILFVGAIEDNLRLSNKSLSLDLIIETCRYIGIHDFIESLPYSYQTIIRERASNLSTGQKQLLAFARALIHNPDGLLILDEATANIDTESEIKIQKAIEKLAYNRASIIIAHRLSTIQHCDRIIVLENGQIVEEGRHFDLLNKGGYYANLYKLQHHHESLRKEDQFTQL